MTLGRRGLLIGGGAAVLGGAAWFGWRQMGSADEMAAQASVLRQVLPARPETRDLIRYATLAANGHNTQAWKFRERPTGIDIFPDLARGTPVVDPDQHHLFISLGCAAENLRLALAARGRGGEIAVDATGDIVVHVAAGGTNGQDLALFEAIPARQSTRSDYDGSAVSLDALTQLAAAAALPGVDLVLLTASAQMTRLRDLVVAANSAQIADPAFGAELKQWLRFNPNAAMISGDGLYSAASGNPALPDWLGESLFDRLFTAASENEKCARQIASSSGIAVFSGTAGRPDHWVQVGRACQRFALQATALGLKCAFMNQPVEVADFRADLAALVGLPGRRPDILMRFGRGAVMPYSLRRPVEAVMA
jgi:nitroreductase